jgi:hypothetical protein
VPDILSCLSQPTPRLALAAQEHGLETRLRPQFVTVEAVPKPHQFCQASNTSVATPTEVGMAPRNVFSTFHWKPICSYDVPSTLPLSSTLISTTLATSAGNSAVDLHDDPCRQTPLKDGSSGPSVLIGLSTPAGRPSQGNSLVVEDLREDQNEDPDGNEWMQHSRLHSYLHDFSLNK